MFERERRMADSCKLSSQKIGGMQFVARHRATGVNSALTIPTVDRRDQPSNGSRHLDAFDPLANCDLDVTSGHGSLRAVAQ
jgi:hypothetical protein